MALAITIAAALIVVGFLAWRLAEKQRALIIAHGLREGILKTTDDPLFVLDSELRIVYANPAAEMMRDYPVAGKVLLQVIDNLKLETLMHDVLMLRGESVERRIEYERRVINARASVIQAGPESYRVLILRDVTEMQRLERARREMVSNVSHELSTPITTIGLLADTLLDGPLKDKHKRARKMVADIRREVDTLAQLVQEMRDLSLIESGQMPVRLMPVDFRSVVGTSVETLLPLAENKEQEITLNIPDDISILADELQIRRAIKNILHNAVKFSPRGGHIQITATSNGDEAVLAVKDSGPGISAEELPRVFERFYQVDRARRNGTGLGLAIVRHIVVAHGGRTWAESIEGHGSTFYIALALAEE